MMEGGSKFSRRSVVVDSWRNSSLLSESNRDQENYPIALTTFAGTPATTTLSGTSFVTAAMMEFSPMVTPGMMVALAPIQAFFLTRIGATVSE